MEQIEISEKQAIYINEATHRWNGKVGATQCGKTYVDTLYVIPNRIEERKGKKGLNFIVGVSKETITRNIIEPLQELFGNKVVTDIASNNTCRILGEKVYCIGADNVGRVRKFRGARIKYLYIDEVYDINEEVFELLKSRLSFEYSVCDFAGNPQHEEHWFEKFLQSDADIYLQRYTLFDNPFLPKVYIDNLCKEYVGTIYYDRYILGRPCNAQGLCYKKFANNPERYGMDYQCELKTINGKQKWVDNLPLGETVIGIDYGGTKSGQAFVCTRIAYDYTRVVTMASIRITDELDSKQLLEKQIEFIEYCRNKFHCNIDYVYPDNEESVHIRSLDNAVRERGWNTVVRGSRKYPVNDRIEAQNKMLAFDIWKYLNGECDSLVKAMKTAMWDDNKLEDTRLDDFSTDIDSMDAYEYSYERDMKRIMDAINYEEVM
nr:MAG TPA: large terminase [Caudoviricetes sp.]